MNNNSSREQGVRDVVHDVILSILPGLSRQALDESRHLKDLGADSVDRVEIIMEILNRMGVKEPMSTFSPVENVAALIGLLTTLEARDS